MIVELTGDLFSLLPIVIVILIAKYTSEFGCDSIYTSVNKRHKRYHHALVWLVQVNVAQGCVSQCVSVYAVFVQ